MFLKILFNIFTAGLFGVFGISVGAVVIKLASEIRSQFSAQAVFAILALWTAYEVVGIVVGIERSKRVPDNTLGLAGAAFALVMAALGLAGLVFSVTALLLPATIAAPTLLQLKIPGALLIFPSVGLLLVSFCGGLHHKTT